MKHNFTWIFVYIPVGSCQKLKAQTDCGFFIELQQDANTEAQLPVLNYIQIQFSIKIRHKKWTQLLLFWLQSNMIFYD